MTFHPDASHEHRLVERARPSESAQAVSVQVSSFMDQFNSIKDSGKKCTADLPDFGLDDDKTIKEKKIILAKEKKDLSEYPDKVLIKDPPDKNDGYMLAKPTMHKIDADQYAHNKEVFLDADTDHNGRLSLREVRHALTETNSDLTKLDRIQLQSQENQILKHFAITGLPENSKSHKFDPTMRQYLEQNQYSF